MDNLTLAQLIALAALMGLIVGSFVNVVIVRLPRMMEHEWAVASAELRNEPIPDAPRYNLAWPRSHCPHCQHTLAWHELVPVVSWLVQRGRCRSCAAPVSRCYPGVELVCAALFAGCAATYGASFTSLAAMALCATLLALAVIDARTMLLPDALTQPLLWLGLLVNLAGVGFAALADAVLGAAIGYGLLWVVATGFRVFTGREGMGLGDVKLLAVLGAWFGWQGLAQLALVASLAGVAIGLLLRALGRAQAGQALAFGPYLAVSGMLALFWRGGWLA